MFESQQTEVRIPENTPIHSPVLSVQAVSPKGQKLIYSIVDGDRYGDFAVDFNTGMYSHLGQFFVVVYLNREHSVVVANEYRINCIVFNLSVHSDQSITGDSSSPEDGNDYFFMICFVLECVCCEKMTSFLSEPQN